MSNSLAPNYIAIDTEYEIPPDTLTEIVFGGSPETITYNGQITLFPRDRNARNGLFQPNASVENQWLVDGKIWKSIKLTGDADFHTLYESGALVSYFHVGYRVENGLAATGQIRYYSAGKYSTSQIRLLEKAHPYGLSTNPVSISQSIAAGGADLSGNFTVVPGDDLIITMAISQISLGTTPHASYIYVDDYLGNTVTNAVGAAIPSLVVKSKAVGITGQYGNAAVTYSYKLHNGDSVAHWFVLNVYRVIA